MNGGSRSRWMSRPLTRPMAAPAPTPRRIAIGMGRPHETIAMEATRPPRAITDATDRSMPPMSSTSVMPTAPMPMSE